MAKHNNYRAIYFRYNKPVFNRYQCVYCRKWFTKDKITIDHVLPQNFWRKVRGGGYIASACMLPFPITLPFGLALGTLTYSTSFYEHSRFNLVASCGPCNSSKSDKLDYRIIKSKLLSSRLVSVPYDIIRIPVRVVTFPVWGGFKAYKWVKRKFKRKHKK